MPYEYDSLQKRQRKIGLPENWATGKIGSEKTV